MHFETLDEAREALRKLEEFRDSNVCKLIAEFCHENSKAKLQEIRDEIAATGNPHKVTIGVDVKLDGEPMYGWYPNYFYIYSLHVRYSFEKECDVDDDIANVRELVEDDGIWDEDGNYDYDEHERRKIKRLSNEDLLLYYTDCIENEENSEEYFTEIIRRMGG